MKTIVLSALPLALLAADPKKPAAKPAPAPAVEKVAVPADAVEIAPRVWRHTDKSGKTWIYRQTPFGLSKVEDMSAGVAAGSMPAVPGPQPVEVKATDLGETIRFEKPTPMGNRVWTRKKSELSTEEKEWLDKSQPSSGAAGQTAGK